MVNTSFVRFQVITAAGMNMTVFWDVAPCRLVEIDLRFRAACCLHHQGDEITSLIALMIETASSSGTSVNFYQQKRRNIPEDSPLHDRRRENLKTYRAEVDLQYVLTHVFRHFYPNKTMNLPHVTTRALCLCKQLPKLDQF
jgi:hypothetical protein